MKEAKPVAIVTGANKGIGLAIVRALCKKFNGDVILTARDVSRGTNAVESLKAEGLEPIFHQLDICSDTSVAKFAAWVLANYRGIDILVNNAGFAYKRTATEPVEVQAKDTLEINYYGTRRIIEALEPLLRPHARVVNVSSSASLLKSITSQSLKDTLLSADTELSQEQLNELVVGYLKAVDDGTYLNKGWPNSTYAASKMFVTALTKIQQRRFNEDAREDLIANAVHPGYVDTDMSSHSGPLSPDQGAEAPVYCALLEPNVSSPKGELVWWDKTVVDWIEGGKPSY